MELKLLDTNQHENATPPFPSLLIFPPKLNHLINIALGVVERRRPPQRSRVRPTALPLRLVLVLVLVPFPFLPVAASLSDPGRPLCT
jgi:hypothetical protein